MLCMGHALFPFVTARPPCLHREALHTATKLASYVICLVLIVSFTKLFLQKK